MPLVRLYEEFERAGLLTLSRRAFDRTRMVSPDLALTCFTSIRAGHEDLAVPIEDPLAPSEARRARLVAPVP